MEKATLLLVDDNKVMCEFYSLFLSKKYNTVVELDPIDALSRIKNGFAPDLIVSDLNMPGLNGVELITQTRKYLPDTPILVVSGVEGIGKRRSLEAGADEFLPKPFHPAELAYRIGKLLQAPRVQRQTVWQRLFA